MNISHYELMTRPRIITGMTKEDSILTPLQKKYRELLKLAKEHLKEEYTGHKTVTAEQEAYEYFKALNAKKQSCAPAYKVSTSQPQPQKSLLPKEAIAPKALPSQALELKPVAPLIENKDFKSNLSPYQAKEPNPKELPLQISPKAPSLPPKAKAFERASQALADPIDFTDMRKIFAEKFPHIAIIEAVPSDEAAIAFANRWQNQAHLAQVLILSFNETPKEKNFLTNLSHAINTNITSASLLAAEKAEIDQQWAHILDDKAVKLIIACSAKMELYPGLMKYFRLDPVNANHTLQRVPLCLLSDILLYTQEPKLKAGLWHTLCKHLKVSHGKF